MIETDDIFERARKQYFRDKFNPALDEWKKKNTDGKSKRATDEAFSKIIGVHKNMIVQYRQGIIPRPETLKKIINVLGVPDDYFTPTTKDELYKYSPEYMTDLGETKILPYCEEIGLDPHFLEVINDLFGEDLGDQFPFWTQLIRNPNFLCDPSELYIRLDPVEFWSSSAEMKPDVKMFQIEVKKQSDSDDRKRITLSYSDLLFLRDVQDEVRDYIEFLFLKRKKELRTECEEASKRAQIPLSNGGYELIQLRAEDLNEIDKYCDRYVDSKVKTVIKRRKKDGND